MQHDAKCIISLLAATGPEFSGVFKKMENCNAIDIFQWIVESLDLIYTPEEINDKVHSHVDDYEPLGASDEACMVTAVITQWVVRFMCKKLMQLMTPEAAILKRRYLYSCSYFYVFYIISLQIYSRFIL